MTATLSSLAGRTAFISGAGHGIGRATALALAARGAVVGINDLKPEFVEDAVAAVRAAGGQAIGLPCNVATRDGMREAVQRFAADAGRLDVMVNNAAWVRYQSLPEITPEVMDRMVEIGFKSVIWGIQAAAEAMDAERGGAIVNVASIAAFKSPMRSVVYSGIKAGVLGITRAAAADLGARRIRVNAVAPGAVPTEGTVRNRNAELDAKRIARTPLGRLGTVQDIADAIVFLASDEARFLNAEVLRLDGGASETSL
ncbi:3-oxoacyl-[acyl-carrier protein] reductase [Pseudacidovorax intermedius]|uniref:3-oxoacyl-[acyl-carrier protein] reductase n=2 Tax=Pseudacidovorax intermedius TaxID=433924 RepID=A0A370FHE0_9BURK|nr:glucose 1-dehydrogenase [Pseudacidovorax intermedius]RDI26160.1 3-oxoacyl-[acyl-carrier protein] reductase [Pseudacidovorax intermedius]